MSKQLTQSFICECNNKDYFSRARLKSHQKSMKHELWAIKKELVTLKGELTVRDNDLGLKTQVINYQKGEIKRLKKELEIEKLATEKACCMVSGKQPKRRRRKNKKTNDID